MANWTAEVLSIGKSNNAVELRVTNDEGFKQLSVYHVNSLDEVKAIVRGIIAAQETQKAAPVVMGVIDLAPKPPVVVPPTQKEIDRSKWFADFNAERTQQILATLSPALAAAYKPEYGELI